MYFTDEMIALIVEQSNLYAQQKNINFVLTTSDFLNYLKVTIIMSIVEMKAFTDYWQTSSWGLTKIRDIMSLKKYIAIRKVLHFANNDEDKGTDGFYKIRQLFELFRTQCVNTPNERHQSIDEMLGIREPGPG